MKVRELIEKLKYFNPDADIEVLVKEKGLLYAIDITDVKSGTKAEELTSIVAIETFETF